MCSLTLCYLLYPRLYATFYTSVIRLALFSFQYLCFHVSLTLNELSLTPDHLSMPLFLFASMSLCLCVSLSLCRYVSLSLCLLFSMTLCISDSLAATIYNHYLGRSRSPLLALQDMAAGKPLLVHSACDLVRRLPVNRHMRFSVCR